MKDQLDALHGLADDRAIGHIARDDFDVLSHMSQIGARAGAPIIQNANFMTRRQQSIDEMRADEPAAPRHQT